MCVKKQRIIYIDSHTSIILAGCFLLPDQHHNHMDSICVACVLRLWQLSNSNNQPHTQTHTHILTQKQKDEHVKYVFRLICVYSIRPAEASKARHSSLLVIDQMATRRCFLVFCETVTLLANIKFVKTHAFSFSFRSFYIYYTLYFTRQSLYTRQRHRDVVNFMIIITNFRRREVVCLSVFPSCAIRIEAYIVVQFANRTKKTIAMALNRDLKSYLQLNHKLKITT